MADASWTHDVRPIALVNWGTNHQEVRPQPVIPESTHEIRPTVILPTGTIVGEE